MTTDPVLTAWLAAEEAFNTAALTSDATQPDLAVTTVFPQLGWSRSLLLKMQVADQIARGPVGYGTPDVTSLSPRFATVRSCVHDAEIVVSARSGRPVSGVPGQVDFELFISTMESTATGWKLATQTVGVGRCG